MYYAFMSNVYLVHGRAKSCIYDLNRLKLYSINKELADKLEIVNKGQLCENEVDGELKAVIDDFVDKQILKLSDLPESHQIEEIKEVDTGCKFAWIEITTKCNLRCLHCYNESDICCDNIMSLENFKRIIDILVMDNVRRIQIIGGEPFIDKSMLKNMLDYTIGKFDFVEIFSNGTLIPETWMEYLAENNFHLALSVYSYVAEMHDNVTGVPGSLEKTKKTIQNLKEYGIQYRVCNVRMKNLEIGEKNTDLYSLKEDRDVVRISGRASLSLLSDELIKKRLITKKTFQTPIKKEFCKRLVSGHNCFWDKIYISANLEVFPCVMERRMKHCTINEKNQILLDERIRSFSKKVVNECCNCEYKYACFDCRPNSLSSNISEKPWYCTYNPDTGEWMEEDRFIVELKKKWNL